MALSTVTMNDSVFARTALMISDARALLQQRARSRRLANGLLSFDDRLLEDLGLERARLTDFK